MQDFQSCKAVQFSVQHGADFPQVLVCDVMGQLEKPTTNKVKGGHNDTYCNGVPHTLNQFHSCASVLGHVESSKRMAKWGCNRCLT